MARKYTHDAAPQNTRDLARTLYEAYGANSDNKTFDGRQMPTWAELTPEVKGHWVAVAETAMRDAAVVQATELARQNETRRRERATGRTADETDRDDVLAAQNAARSTEGNVNTGKSQKQLDDERSSTEGGFDTEGGQSEAAKAATGNVVTGTGTASGKSGQPRRG